MRIDRVLGSPPGWISKWTWGGVGSASPVLPVKPSTRAGLDCAAVHRVGGEGGEVGVEERVAASVWSHRRLPEIGSVPTRWTVPSATASTGAPNGAKTSLPSWTPVVGAGGAEVVGGGRLAVDGERVALAGEALGDLGARLRLGVFFSWLGRGGRGGRRRGGGGGDDRVLGDGGRGGDADLRALGQRAVGAAEDQREARSCRG